MPVELEIDVQTLVTREIDHLLPTDHAIPEVALLYQMMRAYPTRPSKMLRARMLVASALAHGGMVEAALPLAAAMELFQNWVLIHDDIEDDSEERRGLPALHREFGTALSINAGDALHVYMWQAVYQAGVPAVVPIFLEMIHRTAEGQHIDLAWVVEGRFDLTDEDYLEMVRRKTAYYTVVAPLQLGALAAGCSPDPRLVQAGLDLGVAFQVRDDVLNLEGEFAKYGKEIGGDILEGKRTLILLHLLAQLPSEIRAQVLALLERPRAEKTAEDVALVLSLMREHGSITYAQDIADRFASSGLTTLEAVFSQLPGRSAAQLVIETARSLATRIA